MTTTDLMIDPEWGVAPDDQRFETAWQALTTEALLADRSARRRMTFGGDKAAEALTGLVTNDVLALQPGHGQFAAALTVKGKILADLRVLRRDADLLVDVSAAAAEPFAAMVRKYVNPRLARWADISASTRVLAVFGPRAAQVVAHALAVPPAHLESLPDWAHVTRPFEGADVLVVRACDLGLPGFECIVPADAAEGLRDALRRSGATAGSAHAFEAARILAGWPRWGRDMDDTTLTQEANLDALGAVSYTKGCYTGQEVVARLHFRGHVNRQLRGLSADGTLPAGSRLLTMDGREVGEVRSAATVPGLGSIALAMVRREVETGETVTARWEGHALAVRVVELPFPSR